MTANEPAPSVAGGEQPKGELPGWTLADRINHLFATVLRPDGSRYSNDEVAAKMSNVADGPQISGAYLSLLRRGDRDNPTKRHLEALARFFSVSPAYFFDDAEFEAIAEELQLLRTLADSGVKRIATRLGGLSPESLRNIANIIEQVRKIEGLDTQKAAHPDDE
jgi:transcriptional regulator with XRE-family HTH domain